MARYLDEGTGDSPWSSENLRTNAARALSTSRPSVRDSRYDDQGPRLDHSNKPMMEKYLGEKPSDGPWNALGMRGGGDDSKAGERRSKQEGKKKKRNA